MKHLLSFMNKIRKHVIPFASRKTFDPEYLRWLSVFRKELFLTEGNLLWLVKWCKWRIRLRQDDLTRNWRQNWCIDSVLNAMCNEGIWRLDKRKWEEILSHLEDDDVFLYCWHDWQNDLFSTQLEDDDKDPALNHWKLFLLRQHWNVFWDHLRYCHCLQLRISNMD
jgi:hypothetical protein